MSDDPSELEGDSAPDHAGAEPVEEFKPPTFLEAARGAFPRQSLRRQKGPRPRAQPATGTAEDAQRVNYIDRRERLIGSFLAIFQLVFGVVIYFEARRTVQHATKTISAAKARQDTLNYHHAAPELLVINVILGIAIAGGVLSKRRALTGFTILMGGLGLNLAGGGFIGIVYLGIGLWLVFRAMRRKPAAAGVATTGAAAGAKLANPGDAARAKAVDAKARKAPAPSKRYTPPRPTRRPVAKAAVNEEPEKESRFTSWLRR